MLRTVKTRFCCIKVDRQVSMAFFWLRGCHEDGCTGNGRTRMIFYAGSLLSYIAATGSNTSPLFLAPLIVEPSKSFKSFPFHLNNVHFKVAPASDPDISFTDLGAARTQ